MRLRAPLPTPVPSTTALRNAACGSFAAMRAAGVAGVLLAGLLLSGCGEDQANAGEGGERSATTVTTGRVQQMPWSDTIRALGTVRARESVDVTAKVSETVQRVHFESGDEVAAGAPLVTLSGQQQQAALAAAQATAEEADRLYRRQSELAAQQLVARASLDAQRATRDATRAQVAQIQANLRDRVIRAPFAGVLGIRQVSPGALVTPGTVVASLDDIARVYVDFPVPETELAKLGVGQRLTGSTSAWPGKTFNGLVSTIDARVDAGTRAVTVRGDFPNPSRELRAGMLVQVVLERPERPALVVPEIAIVQVGRDSFVYRVKPDDTVEQVKVEIGGRNEGRAEITAGLKQGERIVVDGTGKLRPGMLVAEAASGSAAAPAAGRQGDDAAAARAAPDAAGGNAR